MIFYSCYGDESRCRSLLKRAVDSVQDHPDLVFGVYLSFEREKGTLDSLVAAEERVGARRAQLKRRAEREQQRDLDTVRGGICRVLVCRTEGGRHSVLYVLIRRCYLSVLSSILMAQVAIAVCL